MTYIFSSDLPHPGSNIFHKRFKEQWRRYRNHLETIRHKLPASTRDFALADWYYSEDPRCPRLAWLESVTIREPFHGDRSQYRSLEILVRLLGAFHNGYIELTYRDVQSYCFDVPFRNLTYEPGNRGHRDWRADEIKFSDHGKVLHEIEWDEGGHWIIECKEIEYKWLLKDSQEATGSEVNI
jgi:hypothetical protein